MDLFFFGPDLANYSWIGYFAALWDLVFVDKKHSVCSGDSPSYALGQSSKLVGG
jgi:hypothetical protein